MKWHLVFPLLASVIYVAAALLLKRAQQLGAGVLRTTFVANLAVALVFTALLPFGGKTQPWTLLWQPALVGLLFVTGQTLSVLALARGEVSVATPVLGAKTIFVACFTTMLLATRLPWQLWCAAGLSFGAILLLNRTPGSGAPSGSRAIGRTLVLSLLAALAYALFDVLVQKWAPVWGAGRFLPIALGLAAVFSGAFFPFFREPLRAVPRAAWPPLAGGAALMGLQALSLVSALAIFHDATSINVVYSARGVWSIAAVWLIGHWFSNTEAERGGSVLRWRLAGAILMTSAIVLVVTK